MSHRPDGLCLILEHAEAVDAAARRLAGGALTAFADNRPIPDDFDGDPEDLADALGPWDEWFDSRAGLKIVSPLRAAVLVDAGCLPGIDAAVARSIADELELLERCLRLAADGQARFRLETGA